MKTRQNKSLYPNIFFNLLDCGDLFLHLLYRLKNTVLIIEGMLGFIIPSPQKFLSSR